MKSMRRLLLIFVVGFAIASILIYFFGDSGLFAYRRLDDYRQSLAINVEKLQARNTGLAQELTSLRDDPQRSLVMAREIGLYRAGDEVVKLEGLARPPESYEVGDLLKLRKNKTTRNTIFKATGIGISALLGALAVLAGRVRSKRRSA
jgi:cell division protein FtsB